ncbi:MAG: molecular chaperone Hsp33 [Novosphingobium sp. 35-62-5]|nr:MAG: molecular chaperone Hsp33 [Novosphingobium sp. 35-62-5]
MKDEGVSEPAQPSTGFDRVMHFTLPDRNARGRIVRLGPVLDTILSAHAYPAPIRHVLAEALAITALLGALLKDQDSQLTLQAQTQEEVIDLLVCDYRNGEVRGHIRYDRARLDELGPSPSLFALFGAGYLAITFDLATSGQRYQGVVPLEGTSLAEACESYFFQSEQVPTVIRVAVHSTPSGCVAGGMLLQHLPEGEEGRERLHVQLDHPEWEHVAILGGSVKADELVDPALDLESVVWRLFHEEREIRVEPGQTLTRGCRCTIEHYRDVLSRFAAAEQEDMKDDDGLIMVDCAFCSKAFAIDLP